MLGGRRVPRAMNKNQMRWRFSHRVDRSEGLQINDYALPMRTLTLAKYKLKHNTYCYSFRESMLSFINNFNATFLTDDNIDFSLLDRM